MTPNNKSLALILSPAGVLLIAAGRLIIVANFNTTTAVTIASTGGFVNTLLGTIIPLVPVFMPYLALLLLLFRRFLLSIMTFIFAAFISPTSITLAEGLATAETYWNRTSTTVLANFGIAIPIVLIIFVALWIYNRSFIEGLSTIVVMFAAITLLIALPNLHLPTPLQSASNGEQLLLISLTAETSTLSQRWLLLDLVVLILGYVLIRYLAPKTLVGGIDFLGWLLTGTVAVVATIAFLPYIHFIYPVPQNRPYYAEITHDMWLPTERIKLDTHLAYYGYVLSSNNSWFTVLLANKRVIVYLPAHQVESQSVCQPKMLAQPKQYPPLIPWLYHKPPSLPSCNSKDEIALITPFLSRGQSLKEISEIIHVQPGRIICITNAYQRGELSAALRAYECRHDWNAPTPVGQHFWYYPSIVPY
jgi:hypothetical protein